MGWKFASKDLEDHWNDACSRPRLASPYQRQIQ